MFHFAGLVYSQGKEVDVFTVETWDKTSMSGPSRWSTLVQYGPNYTFTSSNLGTSEGRATVRSNNSFIPMDAKAYYSPGWTFWAMPFGCMDIVDAGELAGNRFQPVRNASFGCEGFYVNKDGFAINRDYMVPAYNMSDYYQIFPTWSDGANVAGYRRDKVSPVSFLPAARLAHYRTWTYGAPDFVFKPSQVTDRLVIIFNWDFSPRALTANDTFEVLSMIPPVGRNNGNKHVVTKQGWMSIGIR
jgi:hypothetical protein